VLHSGTFGSHISITDVPFTLRKNGGFSAFYPAAPMVEGSKAHLPKMPWMDGYDETFACGGYVAPNLSFFARIDDITPFVTWPIDADRSQLIIYLLFPEEFFALPNFLDIVAKYRSFMVAIVEEDRSMVQSLQRNMHTATFKPGRMSVLERPINHLVAHNLRRIMLGAPGAA
ncbi:MAG: hypothetical protein FJX56_04990, partial [Alphaproteobacteria bacterium]|nr:hypothetical protein [Alphaproteobacteria bacterium]